MPIATVTAIAGAERISCLVGQSADCTFNVANKSGEHIRLSLQPRVEAPAQQGWFEILDAVERDLQAAGNEQVSVRVQIPKDAPAGTCSFRLRAYATADPEQFADSPAVAIEVTAPAEPEPVAVPPPKPFPWWILAVVGGVLLVVGIVLAVVFWPTGIEVPGVAKKTLNEAISVIEDSGLTVGDVSETKTGTVSPGLVVSQTPKAGTEVDKKAEIDLVVETGRIETPDVANMLLDDAKSVIKKSGLKVGKVRESTTGTVAADRVVSQTPKAGTEVARESTVDLVVKAKPVAIPSLTGTWSSNDAGFYYLSQSGKTLYWYGERSERDPVWSNVFVGQVQGDTIRGRWADVPKGRAKSHGEMDLKISDQGRKLTATRKTGGFGGSSWKRVDG